MIAPVPGIMPAGICNTLAIVSERLRDEQALRDLFPSPGPEDYDALARIGSTEPDFDAAFIIAAAFPGLEDVAVDIVTLADRVMQRIDSDPVLATADQSRERRYEILSQAVTDAKACTGCTRGACAVMTAVVDAAVRDDEDYLLWVRNDPDAWDRVNIRTGHMREYSDPDALHSMLRTGSCIAGI